jgi:DNA polymerase I-like protein with 3'-5' exonuclease and polymerase domains
MIPDYPDLQQATLICVDCETFDPDLEEKGMGAVRDGFICGVAVAAEFPDGSKTAAYYPVKHEGGGNLDRKQVWKYLRDQLTTAIPKTGANLQYDLAYLWSEGIQVAGPFWDIQIAEPLLDENQFSYSLEAIAQKRIGKGKDEEEMSAFIRQHYGAKAGKEKGYIWKCPAHIVAPYAKQDVLLPLELIRLQLAEIHKEEMYELWTMENDLLPILARMHLNGVRVDAGYADQLEIEWSAKLDQLQRSFAGINPKSSKQIAAVLDDMGIVYPRTAKGNPALNAKNLEKFVDQVPMLKDMAEAKKYSHFLNTFIKGYIVNSQINGRVHGQFNQLKGDEYGTVTGRLSASRPNLQNIPNPEKDAYFSAKCRGMFLPEHGQEWIRYDFSQIEYRLLVHFASTLPGGVADVARAQYIDNPATDFHEMCAALTGLSRKQAKNINFGLVYGMGVTKLAASLGLSLAEAKRVFALYHEKAPFAKAFMEAAMQRASNRGYIRTIGNRKRRFEMWESTKFIRKEDKIDGEVYACKDKQEAIDRWGPVKRAHTHAAANAVLQGSSADITKRSMVEGYKRGIYDVMGYPLVTVHDELGFSVETGNPQHEEAAKEMEQIMIHAYELSVPTLVSVGRGANWGLAG